MKNIIAPLCFFTLVNLLSGCVSTQNIADTYTKETFAQSIFAKQPTGADSIITRTAYDTFQTIYNNTDNYKAFVQADSGAWGYTINESSTVKAIESALTLCQLENDEFENQYPCEVININGEWQPQKNKALEILANIPDWTPPDVNNINVPYSDVRHKYYELALAKHLWFFQNALSVNKNNIGVRRSFWLSAWYRLGNEYPAAKTLLRYAANNAKIQVMKEADVDTTTQFFEDFIYLNKNLQRPDKVIVLAKWFEINRTVIFENSFVHLKGILLHEKEYQLYNKYIKPQQEFEYLRYRYLEGLEETQERYQTYLLNYKQKTFSKNVIKLVAVLVMYDRKDEANDIVIKAKAVLDNQVFHQKLAEALQGIIPSD